MTEMPSSRRRRHAGGKSFPGRTAALRVRARSGRLTSGVANISEQPEMLLRAGSLLARNRTLCCYLVLAREQ